MEVVETLDELNDQIARVHEIIRRAGLKLDELQKKKDALLEIEIDIFKPSYEIKMPAAWFDKCNFLLWPNTREKLTPEFMLQYRSVRIIAKDDSSVPTREFDRATFLALLAAGGTQITLKKGTIFFKY